MKLGAFVRQWRIRTAAVAISLALPALVYGLAWVLFRQPLRHWWQLEQLGEVPEGTQFYTPADQETWRLAQLTCWWGKPLDPEKFWKGHPVWNDEWARTSANRHGRTYPPVPYQRPDLIPGREPSFWTKDDRVNSPNWLKGSSTPRYHWSAHEHGYWNWFWMRQLKPPETLEREQADAALRAIPDHRHGLRGEAIHLPPGEVAKLEAIWKDRAGEIGVPPEALTDTTLFWAYVLKKRQEYAFELSLYNRFTNGGDFRIRYLLEGSAVDTNLVTRPLTDVQLRAAKAWKIAYLQRLRHEKVDESYIDAYLKAWNLSPAAVFPEDRR